MAMREKKVKKNRGSGPFSGLISELKKVVYPTRKAVQRNTIIVIVAVLIIGTFISILDFGFDTARRAILGDAPPAFDFGDIDFGDIDMDFDDGRVLYDDDGNPLLIVPGDGFEPVAPPYENGDYTVVETLPEDEGGSE